MRRPAQRCSGRQGVAKSGFNPSLGCVFAIVAGRYRLAITRPFFSISDGTVGPSTEGRRRKIRLVRTRMLGGVGVGVSNDPGYPICTPHETGIRLAVRLSVPNYAIKKRAEPFRVNVIQQINPINIFRRATGCRTNCPSACGIGKSKLPSITSTVGHANHEMFWGILAPIYCYVGEKFIWCFGTGFRVISKLWRSICNLSPVAADKSVSEFSGIQS